MIGCFEAKSAHIELIWRLGPRGSRISQTDQRGSSRAAQPAAEFEIKTLTGIFISLALGWSVFKMMSPSTGPAAVPVARSPSSCSAPFESAYRPA